MGLTGERLPGIICAGRPTRSLQTTSAVLAYVDVVSFPTRYDKLFSLLGQEVNAKISGRQY